MVFTRPVQVLSIGLITTEIVFLSAMLALPHLDGDLQNSLIFFAVSLPLNAAVVIIFANKSEPKEGLYMAVLMGVRIVTASLIEVFAVATALAGVYSALRHLNGQAAQALISAAVATLVVIALGGAVGGSVWRVSEHRKPRTPKQDTPAPQS